jgi:hypothetical protein
MKSRASSPGAAICLTAVPPELNIGFMTRAKASWQSRFAREVVG